MTGTDLATTTTQPPPTATFASPRNNKKYNFFARCSMKLAAKVVFVSLLVFLTCNSLFWFPFFDHQIIEQEATKTFVDNSPTTTTATDDISREPIISPRVDKTLNPATTTTTTKPSVKSRDPPLTDINTTTNSNSNRTLVILSGNLRCGEQAWQSLYTNLLDVNSADLALIGVVKDDGNNNNNNNNTTMNGGDERYPNPSLIQRAKYIWNTPEYDEWADALDLINGTSWRTQVLPQISNYSLEKGLLGGIFNTPSSGAIQGMMKWWLSHYIRNDPTIATTYDTFVLTRTDQYYACKLDLRTEVRRGQQRPPDIAIPRGEDYSGICDRFMVIYGVDKLLDALDVLPPFLNNYDPNVYGKLHNPEGLLMATFKRKQLRVQRISRMMFTCANMDGKDPTRWSTTNISKTDALGPGPAVSRRDYGVDFKYKNEYSLVRYQCVRKPKQLAEQAASRSAAAAKNKS